MGNAFLSFSPYKPEPYKPPDDISSSEYRPELAFASAENDE